MKNIKQLFTMLILIMSTSFTSANICSNTTPPTGAVNSSSGGVDFVTTWKTDNSGSSNNTSITIPTIDSGYNYDVDWDDDGVFDETGITGDITHDFGTIGTYTIRIQGNFPRIYFNNAMDKDKIISIDQWGNQQWTSMHKAFFGCSNLAGQASDIPDLSNVTNMTLMFRNATSFNQNIGAWNTENVNLMDNMFDGATSFNQYIGEWNMDNLNSMRGIFRGATSFNQDISGWNTSNVILMGDVFDGATSFNQDIKEWDTTNVNQMNAMFRNATSFNQDIGGWNVSNLNSVSNMFDGATSFNQDIGEWETGNITDLKAMFRNATSFNQDIGEWDTGNAIYVVGMFEGATTFNQDISGWNTINVTSMFIMFRDATAFNQDIGGWETENVTNMTGMFKGAASFNQNIASWNISSLWSADQMFNGVKLSTENYDALLIGWESQLHDNSNILFSGGNSNYCLGEAARTSLESDGWTISDGGLDCTVGVEGQVLSSIEIYPNPSKDGIYNLSWNDESKMTIKVVDITGKIILPNTEINYSTNYYLDLTSYASGVYFVEFISNDRKAIKKLLLSK